MRDVAVIGTGMTKFGELWGQSIRDIFVGAAQQAITDSGVDHIDSLYVGSMSPGLFVNQEHLGAVMADYLGVNPIPATRVESACASGGVAFRQAFLEVASGASDIVLAGGVEKMTDGADVTDALATAADQEYEVYLGITFPGLYAMIAKAHMHQYGTTREQLAAVAVKNHRNGMKNPNAQFRSEVTLAQVMGSTMVADPLRLLDCKKPSCSGVAEAAPKSIDFLCRECLSHVEAVVGYLEALKLPFELNHRLVRGLDYYTKTVFEIQPPGEGAQSALGGGGRYDDLIEELGGKPTPAIGFAAGMERVVLNLKKQKIAVPNLITPPVFIARLGNEAKLEAMKLASTLRENGIAAVMATGDRSLKGQLRQANSLGSNYAAIIGEDEMKSGAVTLRNMMTGEQETLGPAALVELLREVG